MADFGLDKLIGYAIGGAFAWRAIAGFVYGSSRPAQVDDRLRRVDEMIEKMHEKASDDADRVQMIVGSLEVTVAEHSRDLLHHEEEIRRLRGEGSGSHKIRPKS